MGKDLKEVVNNNEDNSILVKRGLQRKKVRAELKKQVANNTNKEAFASFTTTQKKQSKKKSRITSVVCLVFLAVAGFAIYSNLFQRKDFERGVELGTSFGNVITSEKFMYDSGEPDYFGTVMLCYSDVKYSNLKGDLFYQFDAPEGNLYCTFMKFDNKEGVYDDVLKNLTNQYGSNYEKVDYSESYPEIIRWTKEDRQVSLFASKEAETIDVVMQYK